MVSIVTRSQSRDLSFFYLAVVSALVFFVCPCIFLFPIFPKQFSWRNIVTAYQDVSNKSTSSNLMQQLCSSFMYVSLYSFPSFHSFLFSSDKENGFSFLEKVKESSFCDHWWNVINILWRTITWTGSWLEVTNNTETIYK